MIQDPIDRNPDAPSPPTGGEGEPLPPYRPIACATHDRLEAIAVKGREGVFLWESPGGGTASAVSRIRDIKVQGGAEFLVLSDGTEIRLDRLRKVDGVEVQPAASAESGEGC
jgi:transcriptional antiterminator Rof (Rho-off)